MAGDPIPPKRQNRAANRLWGYVALIAVQAACAVFFVGDVIGDFMDGGDGFDLMFHHMVEAVASAALVAAIAVEVLLAMRLFRRQRLLEDNVKAAAGAFFEMLENRFDDWGLTPSERDVALLTVKGLPIAEVAAMRGSKPGTVKAQLNAIYRKAGVEGRAQLIALMIEEIVAEPLVS